MEMRNITRVVALLCLAVALSSCMKEFLDIKSDRSQAVPTRLKDFSAMLDNNVMNNYSSHMLGEIGSDDYFLTFDRWNLLTVPAQKNGYVWAEDVYEDQPTEDWGRAYEKILYANLVLEGLDKLDVREVDGGEFKRVKGSALFFRGQTFFNLSQLFCEQYTPQSAATSLGLPLKKSSNINEKLQRSTLQETYDQIIVDLGQAVELLPVDGVVNTRPTKAAANTMLAKVYLQMGLFEQALDHANKALSDRSELIDYNSLNADSRTPFPRYGAGNVEVILAGAINMASTFSTAMLNIDSNLFDSYNENDLRKKIYFYENNGMITYKGSFDGTIIFFTGLSTSELLLIRAECNARLGHNEQAKEDMDRLLEHRFMNGTYERFEADSPNDLIAKILIERRKELIYRGVRWHDLKRLNQERIYTKELKRNLNGTIYELPLGDPRWVWQIPPDVLAIGQITPNPR